MPECSSNRAHPVKCGLNADDTVTYRSTHSHFTTSQGADVESVAQSKYLAVELYSLLFQSHIQQRVHKLKAEIGFLSFPWGWKETCCFHSEICAGLQWCCIHTCICTKPLDTVSMEHWDLSCPLVDSAAGIFVFIRSSSLPPATSSRKLW